jgi:hypothetical protein
MNDRCEDAGFSEDSDDHITAYDGLSLETLQLLEQFQQDGCFEGDSPSVGGTDTSTVCIAYTQKDSQVISETYRRLLQKEEADCAGQVQQEQQPPKLVIEDLEATERDDVGADYTRSLLEALERDGVIRINGALDPYLCDQCLAAINTDLLASDSPKDGDHTGFGNVFSRKFRYDMYLRPVGIYHETLKCLLSRTSPLGDLFHELCFPGGDFHELSSLIVDPGADSQPIHPDAPYSPLTPLWTAFVALHDITPEMGPTVFCLGSHKRQVHDRLTDPSQKHALLNEGVYRRSALRKGDVALMDARTLHFGSANESKDRRVLFYFTIRNPSHGTADSDFPGCGSLFADVKINSKDFS